MQPLTKFCMVVFSLSYAIIYLDVISVPTLAAAKSSKSKIDRILQECIEIKKGNCPFGPFCFGFSTSHEFHKDHRNDIVHDECRDFRKIKVRKNCNSFASISRVAINEFQMYLVGKLSDRINDKEPREGWIGFAISSKQKVMKKNNLAIICSTPTGTDIRVISLTENGGKLLERWEAEKVIHMTNTSKPKSFVEDNWLICDFKLHRKIKVTEQIIYKLNDKEKKYYYSIAGNTKKGFTENKLKNNSQITWKNLHHNETGTNNGGYFAVSNKALDYFSLLRVELSIKPR